MRNIEVGVTKSEELKDDKERKKEIDREVEVSEIKK